MDWIASVFFLILFVVVVALFIQVSMLKSIGNQMNNFVAQCVTYDEMKAYTNVFKPT